MGRTARRSQDGRGHRCGDEVRLGDTAGKKKCLICGPRCQRNKARVGLSVSHRKGEGRRRIGAASWLGRGVGLWERPSGREETWPANYGGGPTCEREIELMCKLAGRKGEKGEIE